MWCSPPKLSKAGLCGPINAVLTWVHVRYPTGYGTVSFGLAHKDKLQVAMHVAASASAITLLRLGNQVSLRVFIAIVLPPSVRIMQRRLNTPTAFLRTIGGIGKSSNRFWVDSGFLGQVGRSAW